MSRFSRLRSACLAGLAALSLAAPAAAQQARPALWKVSDPDTTIYLFGTIHLLPKGTVWKSAVVDQAISSSQQLVVETILDEKNPMAALGEMMKLGMSPGLPPLADRVPAAKKARLAELIAKMGAPAGALDGFETWTAGLMLLGLQMQDFGLDPKSGVEANLKAAFEGAGKPVGQLETNAEQFGFFDTLPEAAQRKFLEGVLDDPAEGKAMLDGMIKSWSSGDVAAMAKTFNEEMDEEPALKDALLVKRNANWTNWVSKRLDQPGTILVAVGAGHLAGDASVIAMLQKRGLKVTRVQ